jgi:hypothetical protein
MPVFSIGFTVRAHRMLVTALLSISFGLIWLSAGAHGATEAAPDFRNKEALRHWMNAYRDNPDPTHVPLAVKAMSRLGLLANPEQSGVYIGFVAGVLADNQTSAEQLIEKMYPLPPESQVIIIKAIAFSGLPEWKDLLAKFSERMPARKILVSKYLFGNGKTLKKLPFTKGPFVLDAWWGFYFATGSYAPARQIIRATALAGEQDDPEKLTVGLMAKWTLASNAAHNRALLDFMRFELANHPKAVTKQLAASIAAAESFETYKLRKEALASLNALKTKGPATQRKWMWWGQAGQIVFALGCVVASATGHVELGLPCVVGGAASTAALKMYSLSQQNP